MALPDLTNQYIQDTFQRLLQISSSGDITDGTGSLFIPPNAISASYVTGISSGITWVETTQSADFTAEINKGYLVDSSGSADGVIISLPSTSSFGDQVAVLDATGFASSFQIIMSSSININGQSGGQRFQYDNQSVYLLYCNDTLGWKPIKGINGGTSALSTTNTITFDWLVVAGGGSGGSVNNNFNGGGGGGGGLRTSFGSTSGGGVNSESSIEVLSNVNITVTIGGGGAAVGSTNNTTGNNGSNSFISGTNHNDAPFSIESIGGGGGGGNTVNATGRGSGGGGSESSGLGGSGTTSQGFAGGQGSEGGNRGGGGGGASEIGGDSNGGDGLAVSITGTSVTYAGGGASNGNGGDGGGGGAGQAGTLNTGGGGGGVGTTPVGGGSGIVIIRYPAVNTLNVGAGLASNTITDGASKVTSFTSGTGTVSFT